MGIYYKAIDKSQKLEFDAPLDFSIKSPGVYHPDSPFPGMVIMMNVRGYNFEIVNDCGWEGDIEGLKDITEQVYQDYLKEFPWVKEKYEAKE